MNNFPFFTVIIPTLNEEKYLPRLLKDLALQKEKSFEVLVVDGGSKDDTVNRALRYSKKLQLQVVTSEQQNVSFQRNLGASQAKGEYLVFLDADAQLPRTYLSAIKSSITESGARFITTLMRGDSTNEYDHILILLMNISIELSALIDRPFTLGGNMIVSADSFKKSNGFAEDVVLAEDYDLAQRLNKNGYKLKILRKPRQIFSLRRYRYEGRLSVLRKNAQATLHLLAVGPITKHLFLYPMGGFHYQIKRTEKIAPDVVKTIEGQVKKLISMFF